MRTVEVFWEADRLRIWGMDSALPAVTTSRKRIRPHPYALDHTGIADELAPASGPGPMPGEAVLYLPGIARHPCVPPGFEMDRVPRHQPDQVGIRPWQMPTLDLVGADALALLRSAHTHTVSRSLPHLAALLEAAEALVTAHRVVPQLVEEIEPGGYALAHARWRPLLDSALLSWLRGHVRELPPPARAHHTPDADAVGTGADTMAQVLGALCALTDLVARERLDGHTVDLPGHLQGKHLWLAALTGEESVLPVMGSSVQRQGVLATELREWFAAAHRYAGSVRLGFRLLEPEQDPGQEWPEQPGEEADAPLDAGPSARPPEARETVAAVAARESRDARRTGAAEVVILLQFSRHL